MRLPSPDLLVETWLEEFEVWVTPSLSLSIRETDKYKEELTRVSMVIGFLDTVLGSLTPGDLKSKPYAEILASKYIDFIVSETKKTNSSQSEEQTIFYMLDALSATLFMVTGKSDNNCKCNFPLFLKNELGWKSLPKARKANKKITFTDAAIPKELKSKAYNKYVDDLILGGEEALAKKLLGQFVNFVLSDESYKEQLQSIVYSYHHLEASGQNPNALLSPLVSFQVRGSVAASGGHEPENILRDKMEEWGLTRDVDFNITDVVFDFEAGRLIEESEIPKGKEKSKKEAQEEKKTRAYDFVIPFRTPGWIPRIFIQAQFYAGDSGSVSHKNVDQTSTSRSNAALILREQWQDAPEPRFIEYVDGAGYISSVNGDLKKLLNMPSTCSFFQVKSSPIRLRRELQDIGFLSLLEIEHAILLGINQKESIKEYLTIDGYSEAEIERSLSKYIETGQLIEKYCGSLDISDNERKKVCKSYLLLDIIANNSYEFSDISMTCAILIPGYGPYFGVRLKELGELIEEQHSGTWLGFSEINGNLDWLCERGYIKLK